MTAGRDIGRTVPPSGLWWWSPFLVSCEVTVIKVDLSTDPAREEVAYGWLDEAERLRCQHYLADPHRQFVLCRAALRAILGQVLSCQNGELSFRQGEHGKPFAEINGRPVDLSFSVSHSGQYGLIAHAPGGRLGVDVEQVVPKRHLNSLIEAAMGPDERRELGGMGESDRLHQFFRLWTCKEALVKALGTGFSTDISSFQAPPNFRRGESESVFRFPHLPTLAWRLQDISADGFVAALARELP